jgi:DNA-binding SARP family transcriptional activator
MVEYRILGAVEVSRPDGAVVPTGPTQRLMLALLLLASGGVVSPDRLCEELWGERLPSDPGAALRSQLSRLRRLLGPGAADLVAAGGGYRLRVERSQVDSSQFDDLIADARRVAGEEALALFDRALGLWRGPALGEFAERPFAQSEAVRLEELRLVVREERAELLSSLGRVGDAVAALEALVAEHPEREHVRGALMEALYRHGRHTEALATFQSWRRRLAEDLGLDPSPALARLEREILRHTLAAEVDSERPLRPGGPVTFLFTDIEASTRRWQEQPDRMAVDLAAHDDLLRRTIEAHGGRIFKHTGDGCCAVFPMASAGLVAAVAAQLGLAGRDWGPGDPLRARMALHSGPAEARGGDYFGPALNRGARLLGVAHGGQIVVSRATEELAVDDLPPDVGLAGPG